MFLPKVRGLLLGLLFLLEGQLAPLFLDEEGEPVKERELLSLMPNANSEASLVYTGRQECWLPSLTPYYRACEY